MCIRLIQLLTYMDNLFLALSRFRRRKFDSCVDLCTEILEKNPYDQAAWVLKMRALTEQVFVDDVDIEEEGLAEVLMEDNSIAQVTRPGTSLKAPSSSASSQYGHSQAFRPVSTSGRPVSGIIHPGTQSGRPGTVEQAIAAPRTAHTARPVTSSSGRFVRLGTASMLSSRDGPFVNLARLNISKYSASSPLSKPLFRYIYYHENDIRTALRLAAEATQKSQFKDWWWKVQLGKCYYRLGLLRDAEKQLKSAIKQHDAIENYLHLAKVYVRLDQPLTALEVYDSGLKKFSGETTLLVGIARLHEGLDDLATAVKFYKEVLQYDATSVEAIACIAAHHFYTDQPEVAMRYYRRLLQMGVYNSEVFNNLALCCFYAQQFDLALTCFERALSLTGGDQMDADVWYNISHVAMGVGDVSLAYQCLRLALVSDNDHAEACNNLAILEWKKGRPHQAKMFFQTSNKLASNLYEPLYNYAFLAEQAGDINSSYSAVLKALAVFSEHTDSKKLLERLKRHLASV